MEKTDSAVDIKVFYLYKIICLILVSMCVVAVRFTNVSKIREAIVAEFSAAAEELNLSGLSPGIREFSGEERSFGPGAGWASLYEKVKSEIKPAFFKRLDFQQKKEAVAKIIEPFAKGRDSYETSLLAAEIVNTFERDERLKVLNFGSWALILLSYWLPELVLVIGFCLKGSRSKREVVKLENVFELLGSVRGFKTIDILKEMAEASPLYRGRLTGCMILFKTDRQAALDALKNSARFGKFSRLADILRIYALSDKKLALDILERNRLEREEQMIITAEEDVDLLDVIAFLSVVPVLLELTELIIRPLVEVINRTFMHLR